MTSRQTEPSLLRASAPLWVAGVAIVALAANLRIAVNSVGATLPEMRETLGLSGAAAGLLTALPPFCFGIMGLAGPTFARRFGLERTALLSAVVLTAGQVLRAVLPGQFWLLVGSTIALAAIALANVIMPSLVRKLFPHRIASMTTVYTTLMTLFAALTSFVTLPIQAAFGGDYRLGLGMWAVVSLLAVLPWIPAIRSNPYREPDPPLNMQQAVADEKSAQEAETGVERPRRLGLGQLARVPKAWILALLFGTQSLQAYIVFGWLPTMLHDSGLTSEDAATQVGILSVAAAAATLVIPPLVGKVRRPSLITWPLTAAYASGYVGFMVAPSSGTALWSVLVGIGQTFFPIALYLVNLRARTHEGVLALSAFMQCVGYIYAGTALFAMGTIHGSSTDWTWVFVFVLVLCVIQQVCALVGVSRWYVEDFLDKPKTPVEPDPHR